MFRGLDGVSVMMEPEYTPQWGGDLWSALAWPAMWLGLGVVTMVLVEVFGFSLLGSCATIGACAVLLLWLLTRGTEV